MTTYSIPPYQSLPLSGVTSQRKYLKYSVEMKSIIQGSDTLDYFVEKGQPSLMAESDLGAEIFNHDLLKVNVSDNESIFAFVEKHGIPVSPLYEGHQRMAWFRSRTLYPFSPLKTYPSVQFNYLYADSIASFNSTPKTHNVNPCGSSKMEHVLVPALYSEIARAKEAENKSVIGAISVLETAQTIRLLQASTAVCTAYQGEYDQGSNSNIESALSYIRNKRFLPKEGALYFVSDPNLLPFDQRCEQDMAFYQQSKEWKDLGNDPRFSYAFSESSSLYTAALNALTFLQNSYVVSKLPLTLPATQKKDFSGFAPLFSIRKSNAKLESLLSQVSEYGSLTEAIIQQYLFLLSADSPWQKCENCGRFFKRAKEATPGKKLRITRFCSRSCNVSFNSKKTAE